MLSASQRSHRVRLERRAAASKSESGNPLQGWQPIADRWAAFRPQTGRERLAAGRLESGVEGVLTVLACALTAGVQASDRAVFTLGPFAGRAFDILAVTPTADRREIEFALREETR